MARRIRHHVPGGWYHITTRGLGRRRIFQDDHDRQHFAELLGEMVSRYGVVLHAYVLMDNHYHLLIETPTGNASRALQWLNVSYAVWYNGCMISRLPFRFDSSSLGLDTDVGF